MRGEIWLDAPDDVNYDDIDMWPVLSVDDIAMVRAAMEARVEEVDFSEFYVEDD